VSLHTTRHPPSHVFSSLNRPSQKFRPPWTSPLTRSPYLLPCNPLCLSQHTNNHPRPWRPRNPTFHNNLHNSHNPIDTPLPCAIFHHPMPHHMKEIQLASSSLCGAKLLTYRMHCQPKARHPPPRTHQLVLRTAPVSSIIVARHETVSSQARTTNQRQVTPHTSWHRGPPVKLPLASSLLGDTAISIWVCTTNQKQASPHTSWHREPPMEFLPASSSLHDTKLLAHGHAPPTKGKPPHLPAGIEDLP